MSKRWRWLLALLLLWGGYMWLAQLRFTPEAAVRTLPRVGGELVQVQPLPGAAAVLLQEGGIYHGRVACRWGFLFWEPCGGTSLVQAKGEKPVEVSASYSGLGRSGRGISVLMGIVHDERVARIVWGDLDQTVTPGGRAFVIARWVEPGEVADLWRPTAYGLSAAGVSLYEWNAATFYEFQPALIDRPAFPESPGPATWFIPVPRNQGDWSASGNDPREVARRFVLAGGEACDCEELSVRLLKAEEGEQTYLVELKGLKDDSLRNTFYLVALEETGEVWRVTGASYRTECWRGVSPEGFCS